MILDFNALSPAALHAVLLEANAGGFEVEARGETFTASDVLDVTPTHITFSLNGPPYEVARENIIRIIAKG
jgi:hypothetical protein